MQTYRRLLALLALVLATSTAQADTFGTGANQISIDFVPISWVTNPMDTSLSGGYGIVHNGYRMGTFEITNDQWNKFVASLGVPVTGSDGGYNYRPPYAGTNVPKDADWYEAAQFINWLNTSTGHQAAYKFTGTQGTADYTFSTWSAGEAANGINLYRNKDAFYFLPTEHEWVKAAYWSGTTLQPYATKAGESLFQGNGTNGGWNYRDGDVGPDGQLDGPWDVGSSSQELNGTYDMMGNVNEWMESPSTDYYGIGSSRRLRGGSYFSVPRFTAAFTHDYATPSREWYTDIGFRVASVPEPGCLTLLVAALAGLLCWKLRR